jgi:hypothetical protein
MLTKNTASQGVYLYAYLTTTGLPKTGDASNITGSISKDGAASASTATTNPTEIGGGVYWQPLSQAETNANAVALYWSSGTASVLIAPLSILTDRAILDAAITSRMASYTNPTNFSTLVIDSNGAVLTAGMLAGVVVTGSTATAVIVSGLPSGGAFVKQYLYNPVSGERRVILSHTYSGGNYTFTLNATDATTGDDTTGPFSSTPTTGQLIYPC